MLERISKAISPANLMALAVIIPLFVASVGHYPGNLGIYLLFTLLANGFLFLGLQRGAILFETFLSILFWLGFWMKCAVILIFYDGIFREATGNFDRSGAAFDHGLIVACCGFAGLLTTAMLRRFFFMNHFELGAPDDSGVAGLKKFYFRYRLPFLAGFVLLVILVGLTNAMLGIYQKGSITLTELPFGLNGIYKWLLLFGLASVSCYVITLEAARESRVKIWPLVLAMLECLVSNASQLSRGFVLNAGSIAYGAWRDARKRKATIRWHNYVSVVFIILLFTAASVISVNLVRSYVYFGAHEEWVEGTGAPKITQEQAIDRTSNATMSLLVDRWVGLEGLFAVATYDKLGWDLWARAWQESYNENETSLYDNDIIVSPYKDVDRQAHHFISLPGAMAFFYYPGSLLFLYFAMAGICLVGTTFEWLTFRLGGGNIVFCSLIAQIVAYRFASFGYVPQQSYLLFGTIIGNLILVFAINKSLDIWIKNAK